jgi:Ca2+-binding RTX toxin-like protein
MAMQQSIGPNATIGGTPGNDTLEGTDEADRLNGKGGDDRLFGHSGDDRLIGEGGHDELFGADGADVLQGGNGNDLLDGGGGDDTIDGGDGNDELHAYDGTSVLRGGSGNDNYFISNANATVYELSTGTDVVFLNFSAPADSSFTVELKAGVEDVFFGNSGAGDLLIKGSEVGEEFNGSGSNIKIQAGGGNDSISFAGSAGGNLQGGGGNDVISGGSGDDTIKGNSGDDHITSNDGDDTLTGGAGQDWFYFDVSYNEAGSDDITDFDANFDRIVLELQANGELLQLQASQFRASRGDNVIARDGDDIVLFDKDTGDLYYDADANGAGGRVLIAQLDVAAGTVSYDDVFLRV